MSEHHAELQALTIALLTNPEAIPRSSLAALSDQDWSYIRQSAKRQRCKALLDWNLAGINATDGAVQEIENRRYRNALSLQGECLKIHQLLNAENIPHYFLKGTALSGLYPMPWLRSVRDIDIIVPEDQLYQAYELLLAAGGTIDKYAHLGQGGENDAKHLTPIYSPGRRIALEVHRCIFGNTIHIEEKARKAFLTHIWQRPGSFQLGPHALPCLRPEDMLIHLVFHAIYDSELSNGPLFLCDVKYLLTKTDIDSRVLLTSAKDLNIERGLAISLELVSAYCPQAEALLAELDHARGLSMQSIYALLLQSPEEQSMVKLTANFSEQAAHQKIAMAFAKLCPRRETMINRWLMEKGLQELPKSNIRLWAWYIQNRLQAALATGLNKESYLREHTLALRQALSDSER